VSVEVRGAEVGNQHLVTRWEHHLVDSSVASCLICIADKGYKCTGNLSVEVWGAEVGHQQLVTR
jgi:hypothetical protein